MHLIMKQEINWKLPPEEKIYEAFSVLADNRYELTGEGKATVTSSGGDKKYQVSWSRLENKLKVFSNDNASRWQGYTGYPIIAVLMFTGMISIDRGIIRYFKDIPWNTLNKAHKNNYRAAVEEVLAPLNPDVQYHIREEVKRIYDRISEMVLVR